MESKKKRVPHPLNDAGLFNKFFFLWTIPLVKIGCRRPLNVEDLYTNRDEDDASLLGDYLHREWEKECMESKVNNRKPKFCNAVLRCFKGYIISSAFIAGFQEFIVRIGQPLFLVELIRYFAGEEGYNDVYAWICATGIGVFALIYVGLHHADSWITATCGMKTRIACSTLIYRKVLRLSTGAISKIPVGQLVNMLSNDVNIFDMNFTFFNYIWIAPIQAVIVLGILGSELGPSCLAGFMVFVMLIPLQSMIGKSFSKVRLAIATCTDKRVRIMHEVISSMRAIKMFTWEKFFIVILETARKNELVMVKKKALLLSFNTSVFNTLTKIVVFLCLLTYVLLGFPLTADKAFLTSALIGNIQTSLSVYFPLGIVQSAEAYMSCKRLQNVLEMKEKDVTGCIQYIKPRPKPKDSGLTVYEVTTRWNHAAQENTLSNVSCSVKAGELLAIVGPVGSGKSSLLNVILGELPAHAGKVFIQGKIAYSSQEPWVFSGTIRENVVFCQPFNEEKYQEVVRVCALEQDLKELPNGDFSMVGEHGTALSGGQKARVNLARAIYSDADIYLLDDPLSAVDAHVGRHIFDNCIMKYLRHKVRILATHQVQYLKEARKILVLKEGHTQAFGSYPQLMNSGIDIGSVVEEKENTALFSEEGTAKSKQGKNDIESRKESATHAEQRQKSSVFLANGVVPHKNFKKSNGSNNEEQQKSSGSVKASVFFRYFLAGAGWPFLILFPFGSIIIQLVNSGTDYWLSYWTNIEQLKAESMVNMSMLGSVEETNSSFIDVLLPEGVLDATTNAYIYTGLVMALFVGVFLRSYFFFLACVMSSKGLHNTMLKTLIRAPISFFEFRPAGQILNRFSKDVGQIDEQLPSQLLDSLNVLLSVVGLFVLVATTNLWLLIPAVLIFISFIVVRQIFVPSICNLKRLEGITRSPIFSHLSVSLQGLATVRAFKSENVFIDRFNEVQNLHTSAWFMFLSIRKGFTLALDSISAIFVCVVTFSFIGSTDTLGGDLGLAISSALTISGLAFWGLYQTAEMENQLTSVERLLEYSDLETEAPWEIQDKTPKAEWPEHGIIIYENVSLQYSEYEPPVLKNLTFCIKGGEKVGIVGRTGAGKSSLVSSLFRLTEPSGDIRIDKLSVKQLGLHDLRGHLSIIPQDPALFSATVRMNLDPFNQVSDDKLWEALEEVQMKKVIHLMDGGLDADLAEGGSNLSLGQRQLLCLARAILKHNKILVLDEASASIDLRTDELIQEVIRTKFHDCTVLTIAHRLHTIMDCDRVMVLQAGHLREFDEPHILLQSKNSLFFSMVQQTGQNTSRHLQQIAEYAYLQRRSYLEKL